jgi:predicted protein tyrosine phosphatase
MNQKNRLHNSKNPYQGSSKKVLCVCSAGLLRSPTAAVVLAQEPFNFNTRAAGLTEYALILVDDVLINWADEIVVMEKWMEEEIKNEYPQSNLICLNIKDEYEYRCPSLMKLIKDKYLMDD